MRYKQKEGSLSVYSYKENNAQAYINCHISSTYINGCASHVTPINTSCMINSAEYTAFVMAGPSRTEQWRAGGVVGR